MSTHGLARDVHGAGQGGFRLLGKARFAGAVCAGLAGRVKN